MSRLVSSRILETRNVAGEIQVELVWESVAIAKGDWRGLGRAMDSGAVPMARRVEIRTYPTDEIAAAAVNHLHDQIAS